MTLTDYIADMARREALADALDSSPDYLWQIATNWRGRKASPALAQRIEAATDGAVSKSTLRPDIWPAVETAKAA
jgi:DNA-binding transcriptional regulator YdaS (Cro superfamily)